MVKSKQIDMLSGFRGLAAIIVLIGHGGSKGWIGSFFGDGYAQLGVMMFFMLSGFLMAYLYADKEFNIKNVNRYLFSRIGRVFPLYVLVVVFSYFSFSILDYDFGHVVSDETSLWMSLFFLSAEKMLWSIPVEVQFYFVFLGFWFFCSRFKIWKVFVFFVVFTNIPSMVYYFVFGELYGGWIFTYAYSFFLGVFIFYLKKMRIVNESEIKLKYFFNISCFPAFFILILMFPSIRHSVGFYLSEELFARTWMDPLYWFLIIILFLGCLYDVKSLSFLKSKFFMVTGSISYGLYLIHPIANSFVEEFFGKGYIQFLVACVLVYILSFFSYVFFEKKVSLYFKNKGF